MMAEIVDVFQCHVCGSTEAKQELVSEVFMIAGKRVLVENIPASVCARCSEATFSRETMERLRRMLHGEAKPMHAEMMEVFHTSNACRESPELETIASAQGG